MYTYIDVHILIIFLLSLYLQNGKLLHPKYAAMILQSTKKILEEEDNVQYIEIEKGQNVWTDNQRQF